MRSWLFGRFWQSVFDVSTIASRLEREEIESGNVHSQDVPSPTGSIQIRSYQFIYSQDWCVDLWADL